MDSSRNFMQVSLFSYFFDVFLKIVFVQILVFWKSGSEKKRVFDILTSKKYGVDDPSGISHFCLSSKWHFFIIFCQFLLKNGFGGFLTSKKYGGNVPSGISHFCLSSKWHFFVIFYQFLPKNGFFAHIGTNFLLNFIYWFNAYVKTAFSHKNRPSHMLKARPGCFRSGSIFHPKLPPKAH